MSLLSKDIEIGNEFVHMLKHISDLETQIMSELKNIVNCGFVNDLEHLLNSVLIQDEGDADKQMKIQVKLIE